MADSVLDRLDRQLESIQAAIEQQIDENAQVVQFEGRSIARIPLHLLRAEENRVQEAINRRRARAQGADYDWGRRVKITAV